MLKYVVVSARGCGDCVAQAIVVCRTCVNVDWVARWPEPLHGNVSWLGTLHTFSALKLEVARRPLGCISHLQRLTFWAVCPSSAAVLISLTLCTCQYLATTIDYLLRSTPLGSQSSPSRRNRFMFGPADISSSSSARLSRQQITDAPLRSVYSIRPELIRYK